MDINIENKNCYYKILRADGCGIYNTKFLYSLPTNNFSEIDIPGFWMPTVAGKLEFCKNGYHLCRLSDIGFWLCPNSNVYLAEIDETEGSFYTQNSDLEGNSKVITRNVRLVKALCFFSMRRSKLLACDIAERYLEVKSHYLSALGLNNGDWFQEFDEF